jgi:hypothetical protein
MNERKINLLYQFRGSISGTVGGVEIFDIVQFEDNTKIYVFKRSNRNIFELTVIKRIPFNQKDFDKLLNMPHKLSSDCNIYGGWRSSLIKEPEFMPEQYYFDIKYLYEKMLNSKNNLLINIQRQTQDFCNKINSIDEDNGIRSY